MPIYESVLVNFLTRRLTKEEAQALSRDIMDGDKVLAIMQKALVKRGDLDA
jgi:hypothetical protein